MNFAPACNSDHATRVFKLLFQERLSELGDVVLVDAAQRTGAVLNLIQIVSVMYSFSGKSLSVILHPMSSPSSVMEINLADGAAAAEEVTATVPEGGCGLL